MRRPAIVRGALRKQGRPPPLPNSRAPNNTEAATAARDAQRPAARVHGQSPRPTDTHAHPTARTHRCKGLGPPHPPPCGPFCAPHSPAPRPAHKVRAVSPARPPTPPPAHYRPPIVPPARYTHRCRVLSALQGPALRICHLRCLQCLHSVRSVHSTLTDSTDFGRAACLCTTVGLNRLSRRTLILDSVSSVRVLYRLLYRVVYRVLCDSVRVRCLHRVYIAGW